MFEKLARDRARDLNTAHIIQTKDARRSMSRKPIGRSFHDGRPEPGGGSSSDPRSPSEGGQGARGITHAQRGDSESHPRYSPDSPSTPETYSPVADVLAGLPSSERTNPEIMRRSFMKSNLGAAAAAAAAERLDAGASRAVPAGGAAEETDPSTPVNLAINTSAPVDVSVGMEIPASPSKGDDDIS